MKLATTLVHKSAMPIAVHAVSSFARHFGDTHRLEIHTDGSPDEADHMQLMSAAEGIEARIVTADDRQDALNDALFGYPESAELMKSGGYFYKFQLPMTIAKPFFYFDSDIVWLRPVKSFAPDKKANAFSTESWSWYHGVANEAQWIRERIPRRVNSGFYYLDQEFPHERFERLVKDKLFDPQRPYSTDQEIMAFLYPDMQYYHPEDLKRSRRGIRYDLATDSSAALHFPGRMWEEHMQQIELLSDHAPRDPATIRFEPAVPLSRFELFRMRATLKVAESRWLRLPVDLYRSLRRMKS